MRSAFDSRLYLFQNILASLLASGAQSLLNLAALFTGNLRYAKLLFSLNVNSNSQSFIGKRERELPV